MIDFSYLSTLAKGSPKCAYARVEEIALKRDQYIQASQAFYVLAFTKRLIEKASIVFMKGLDPKHGG